MADFKSDAAEDRRPSATVTGFGQATVNHGKYVLGAALVAADTVALCKLPAGHVPIDFIIDSDAAIGTHNVGVIGGDVDAFIGVQAINGVHRMDEVAGRQLAPSDADRLVGITCTVGGGVATNVITATLISRPAGLDD